MSASFHCADLNHKIFQKNVCNEAEKFYSTEHSRCEKIVVFIAHCTIFNENVRQD